VTDDLIDSFKLEQEQRRKRDQYWSMLCLASEEFLKLTCSTDPGAFFHYLKQNYGLHIDLIDGKLTSKYTVINEQKYLIFLMKFSQ
jgi:hypothetical protein